MVQPRARFRRRTVSKPASRVHPCQQSAPTQARAATAVRSGPKWETEARDRIRSAIKRFSRPLADLVARDANEGDTRLLVTDMLCEALGFDKYEDLTTEYQVKGEFADYGIRIDKRSSPSSK